jgi:hypothetical protein
MRRLASLTTGLVAVAALGSELSGSPALSELETVLERAGAQVERYLARAQSIVCLEVVHLQPLTSGWSSHGLGRTVESEMRLSWRPDEGGNASTEAQTLRQLLRVNGGPPRKDDHNNCTAPEQQTSEPHPLSLLLPTERRDHHFTLAGQTSMDGRAATMVDYRELRPASVESSMVEGKDDCVSFNVEGGLRGRIWIDALTHEVLRIDQRLGSMVEIPVPAKARRLPHAPRTWTMERWDSSIRFKRVTFANPPETLVLPDELTSVRITRGSGMPRLRTVTRYKNYQRFLTNGRVVGE